MSSDYSRSGLQLQKYEYKETQHNPSAIFVSDRRNYQTGRKGQAVLPITQHAWVLSPPERWTPPPITSRWKTCLPVKRRWTKSDPLHATPGDSTCNAPQRQLQTRLSVSEFITSRMFPLHLPLSLHCQDQRPSIIFG